MKAYKIDLADYTVQVPVIADDKPVFDANGDETFRSKAVRMRYELSRIMCNPTLGDKNDKGETLKFDLIELGALALKMEQCVSRYLIVSADELKMLKDRVRVISRYFGYNYYEMFSRVIDAQETELAEVATAKGIEKIEKA